MFKSIFTKYITAFMLITLVSFILLALIMGSLISNYSSEAKKTLVENTADSTAENIGVFIRLSGKTLPELLETNADQLKKSLNTQAQNSEATAFVTDTSGKLLIASEHPEDEFGDAIPAEVAANVTAGQEIYSYSDLGGFFEKKHLNSIRLIGPEDEPSAILFVCAPSAQMSAVANKMTRTVAVATLMVFVVALIAVYLMSEKITEPLKDMSKAAKAFAQGRFDVRVPVSGEDEIGELAKAFNNMASSLEKQEDMRNTFLANISHDLRTPMTSISGIIDCIIDGAIPPEKQNHYLEQIAGEVRRLSRLVSSLLDISRMQAGERKFNMTSFDVCEMARQILISFEQRLDEKKMEVSFDCSSDNIAVTADKDAIHQVLFNLIDNAVKFSNEGGELTIRLEEKDQKVSVSVRNTGSGIPPEDLPFVFDRFYKSDKSRGLDKTGVGLGLFIVRTIIERHGEQINVKSEYGKDCEFTFTLKKAQETKTRQ
ncbi:MAG: HAMP domain-containing histidine kinase [Clostridia bacterium]|nr:HAMP domain-containing histidine kinase [Clostridia bacterium]